MDVLGINCFSHDTATSFASLAELAGISFRHSRSLLAEFRAQPDHHPNHQPAHHNGQPACTRQMTQPRPGRSGRQRARRPRRRRGAVMSATIWRICPIVLGT